MVLNILGFEIKVLKRKYFIENEWGARSPPFPTTNVACQKVRDAQTE
eukprot:SAG31_NODE_480_length_15108_cov_56.073423_6_plen_47_part_00